MPCLRDWCPHILRFHHGIEGYVVNALLDLLRSAFVLEYCSNFDIFLLQTNTNSGARRLWVRRVTFEILICLCRTDNTGCRSFQREWNRQFLSFCRGGESKESAARADFFLAMSFNFLCCSIISANGRLISVNSDIIASAGNITDEVPDSTSTDCWTDCSTSSASTSSSSSLPDV